MGLEVTGRGIVREHQDIYIGGRLAGKTTSGTHCPFLGKAMAMAYLAPEDAAAGTEVFRTDDGTVSAEWTGKGFAVTQTK